MINRFTSWEARDRGNFWVVKFLRFGETGGLPLVEGEGESGSRDEVSIVGKIMFVNDKAS